MVLKQIPCSAIRPETNDARDATQALESLVDSIRDLGVLRPVVLRPTQDGYVIVHGERRWRAARMLGLQEIPAYLVDSLPSRGERVTA
jgi:ParB family transcriptional regulator, chromosome partitioning protein